MIRLAYWLPPVLWMAVIAWLSTGAFSADQTGSLLLPLLRWLLPWATAGQLDTLHALGRKAGHLTEYAILAVLWFRALVHAWPERRRAASWVALALAVATALADEWQQSRLVARTGSAVDVAIDAAGALAALAVARRGWRPAVDAVTTALLWTAAGGGALLLVVDTLAGVGARALWVTAPAAAVVLLVRWRRGDWRS